MNNNKIQSLLELVTTQPDRDMTMIADVLNDFYTTTLSIDVFMNTLATPLGAAICYNDEDMIKKIQFNLDKIFDEMVNISVSSFPPYDCKRHPWAWWIFEAIGIQYSQLEAMHGKNGWEQSMTKFLMDALIKTFRVALVGTIKQKHLQDQEKANSILAGLNDAQTHLP